VRSGAVEILDKDNKINPDWIKALESGDRYADIVNLHIVNLHREGLIIYDRAPHLKILFDQKFGKTNYSFWSMSITPRFKAWFAGAGINLLNSFFFIRPSLEKFTEKRYGDNKELIQFARLLDNLAVGMGTSQWTLAIIGAEIGAVRDIGHVMEGPLGTLAEVLEGENGAISIGHHLYSNVENFGASLFDIETVEDEGIVSEVIYHTFGGEGTIKTAAAYNEYQNQRFNTATRASLGLRESMVAEQYEDMDNNAQRLEERMSSTRNLTITQFIDQFIKSDGTGQETGEDANEAATVAAEIAEARENVSELLNDAAQILVDGRGSNVTDAQREAAFEIDLVAVVDREDVLEAVEGTQSIAALHTSENNTITYYTLDVLVRSHGFKCNNKDTAV